MSGIIGLISVSAATPGAGPVVTNGAQDNGTTRITLLTPGSGKKIRVVGVSITNTSSTGGLMGVYFGTGAAITTNRDKIVLNAVVDLDKAQEARIVFPDGAGPIGGVDDVLSFNSAVNAGGGVEVVAHTREE